MSCSPPGSSVHGISQARILEWIATSFSRGSSWPGDGTCVFCTDRQILYRWATREAHQGRMLLSHFSRVGLCATPWMAAHQASPVPGIPQARTLEWVAISFSNAWKWKVKVKSFSRVRPSATPWTAAYQAPPSMGFSRQEYWSGVPLVYNNGTFPAVFCASTRWRIAFLQITVSTAIHRPYCLDPSIHESQK